MMISIRLTNSTYYGANADLIESECLKVFDMLDVDGSGCIEFDEFYLLCCMLLAVRVRESIALSCSSGCDLVVLMRFTVWQC